jgi:hypothetical protein
MTSHVWGGWAVYDELEPREWEGVMAVLERHGVMPLVGITACWAERDSRLIPFPERFPDEAFWLKKRLQEGRIKIANHGLTHCVLGKHQPRFFGSNQRYWREFYPFLEGSIHEEHVSRSQEILQQFFEEPVTVFVPPGSIWCQATYRALKKSGIRTVIASRYMMDSEEPMQEIEFVHDREMTLNLHDRELKLHGAGWLEETLTALRTGRENP